MMNIIETYKMIDYNMNTLTHLKKKWTTVQRKKNILSIRFMVSTVQHYYCSYFFFLSNKHYLTNDK